MRRSLKAIVGWWLARKLPADLARGDICTVIAGDGEYKIAKVLMTDQSAVHIRLYRDRFSEPPAKVDTATLSLGKIDGADGFGIGHLPLSRSTFASWVPVRIQSESVTEEELEGYRAWEECKGGTWG
jgi:hypothetical protein